jgi:hypothetical protein
MLLALVDTAQAAIYLVADLVFTLPLPARWQSALAYAAG